MKKLLILFAAIIPFAIAFGLIFLRPAAAPELQIFINGVILTMDADNSVVEAIALRKNTIIATGTNEEILARGKLRTLVHNLAGKTLMPGFIDAHSHFPGSGIFEISADLRSPPMGATDSIPELLHSMKTRSALHAPGSWVFGFGYDDTLVAEQRHPTREELDSVSTEHPLFILHTSAHMGVANSRALELMGYTESSPSPAGGLIVKDPETGALTGLVEETAMQPFLVKLLDASPGQVQKMLTAAVAEYLAAGVTTAQAGGTDLKTIKGLSTASKLGLVPLRLELWPMYNAMADGILDGSIVTEEFESDLVRVGAVKIVADGSIQGYTGYLSEPYHTPFRGDSNYRGYPTVSREELITQVGRLYEARRRIAIHGNGDASIEDSIDAVEIAQLQHPMSDPRVVLIHAQMARDDQLRRMLELGITPSFFSAHTYYWGDRHRDMFMGPARAARMSPTRSALDIGLRFSVHMDTPVAPMEPLTLLWSTVNRISTGGQVIGKDQRIAVSDALRAMTIDAAYQIFRDDELGSIEVGKLADLIVLDRNPLEISPLNLRDIVVEQTIVNGVVVFERKPD